MNGFSVLPNYDIRYLDQLLLDEDYFTRPTSLDDLMRDAIPHDHLRVWCVKRARYQLVTPELCLWLRSETTGKRVLEIGAGQGDLGHALGWRMTDSAIQQTYDVKLAYIRSGQEPTDPPPTVERINALAAIAKYKPDVVVGAWITQLWRDGDPLGNQFGVDEEELLRLAPTYIHIGNTNVHGYKRINQLPHRELRFPWLLSRAQDQTQNNIQIWT